MPCHHPFSLSLAILITSGHRQRVGHLQRSSFRSSCPLLSGGTWAIAPEFPPAQCNALEEQTSRMRFDPPADLVRPRLPIICTFSPSRPAAQNGLEKNLFVAFCRHDYATREDRPACLGICLTYNLVYLLPSHMHVSSNPLTSIHDMSTYTVFQANICKCSFHFTRSAVSFVKTAPAHQFPDPVCLYLIDGGS